ncbi:MAG: hypothetical protein H6993_17025 [Pseudomonadales bacterium]|nr:hypothetical protein [Pseudomonadales bacterium]MCP5185672.1 hypothetical protein [Pseudomonadales bacterium]
MIRGVELKHRHKVFHLFLRSSGALELHVDHCLRKRREMGEAMPRYVWTNIELEWEEHHYIEARYWHEPPRLLVTVNGDTVFDDAPPPYTGETAWLREDSPFD